MPPLSSALACFAAMNITVLSRRNLSDPLPGTARVYVGRPSALGNPFPMRTEADRQQVVRKYRDWLRIQWRTRGPARAELERLLEIAKAGPLELVCWCAPRPCHADVIKAALEALAQRPHPD